MILNMNMTHPRCDREEDVGRSCWLTSAPVNTQKSLIKDRMSNSWLNLVIKLSMTLGFFKDLSKILNIKTPKYTVRQREDMRRGTCGASQTNYNNDLHRNSAGVSRCREFFCLQCLRGSCVINFMSASAENYEFEMKQVRVPIIS